MKKATEQFCKECRIDYDDRFTYIRVTHMPSGYYRYIDDGGHKLTLKDAHVMRDVLYNEIDAASNTGKVDK